MSCVKSETEMWRRNNHWLVDEIIARCDCCGAVAHCGPRVDGHSADAVQRSARVEATTGPRPHIHVNVVSPPAGAAVSSAIPAVSVRLRIADKIDAHMKMIDLVPQADKGN